MLSRLFNLPWPPEFFLGGCPCCTTSGCAECPSGAPVVWEVPDISTLSNKGCESGDCQDVIGPFRLTHTSGCIWDGVNFPICNNEADDFLFRWQLEFVNITQVWQLIFASQLIRDATYELAAASFDCLGSNVMPRITPPASISCDGYPSSITISPA